MQFIQAHHWAFAFGLAGNIVSFLVYLAPLPTFYGIVKKKSTQGFQSIPYSVALFSSMLLLYYGFLKTDGFLLITINSIGCVIESIYLLIYLFYATKDSKVYTMKLLVIFNIGVYGVIVLCTYMLSHGDKRVSIVGWVCAVFSVCVFAAPLSIMRLVIRTKSVEFMPISLSFFLTFCAVMWFFYGVMIRDYYIATPNVLGFALGVAQMVLYGVYKDAKRDCLSECKVQELVGDGEKSVAVEAEEEAVEKERDIVPPVIVIAIANESNV